jgi:hypothetical protein
MNIWLPKTLYRFMPVVWLFLSLVVYGSPVAGWLKWITCLLLVVHSVVCICHRYGYMGDMEL